MQEGPIHLLIEYGIGAIILAMLIRAIASLFQIDERFAFIRFLARISDPFITPVRRIMRPVGVMDLSFFVTWFLLTTMEILLIQALPAGW
ncbi:MAG TPA: YggT family protein [Ktedonobacteraceae bacterium]|jgi:YggT family protein|nr:YggT family protein [Ktedonobacteraceae bacterium]